MMKKSNKNIILLLCGIIIPSILFGQEFEEQRKEISNELNTIEETVNICTNSIAFLHGDKSNIQLNVINSVENLINEELEKSRALLNDFEYCITESSARLDSLEFLVSSYTNIDSLTSIVNNEVSTVNWNDVDNYKMQIDSLQLRIENYSLAKEEIVNAINVVEKNFDKEFSVMKNKVLLEIQRAEKQLQRTQRKAESELKKKLKISLPDFK